MSNTDHLLIVTYLWDDPKFKFRAKLRYGPEHVIALYQQLKRFLHVPFYFTVVCDEKMLPKMESWTSQYRYSERLTDRLEDPNLNIIDTYRIWGDCAELGRCWRRLRGFSAYEFGHLSRVLFIDLDTLILDNITGLIENNKRHPFVIADDVECYRSKYNGSFVLFTPTPTTHKMWQSFNANPQKNIKMLENMGYMGSDQAWIRYYLDTANYPVKTIGQSDGLLSYRWHIQDKGIDPFEAGAKMINFHGPYMPDMPEIQEKHRWVQVYSAYTQGQRIRRKDGKPRVRHHGKLASVPDGKIDIAVAMIEQGAKPKEVAGLIGLSPKTVAWYFSEVPEFKRAREKYQRMKNQK